MKQDTATPSESTLLRWRREILKETASTEVKSKLVAYVRSCVRTLGFKPAKLMDAYLLVAHEFAWED